jgi:plastocyanin
VWGRAVSVAPMRRTLACIAGVAVLAAPLAACGGGGGSTPTTVATGPHASLTVHAEDALKFDKTAYTVAAGPVDVTYVNDGSLTHTLKLDHGGGSFKLGIGTRSTGTVTLQKGTYTLFCDLPGHEAAGMKATLTVT